MSIIILSNVQIRGGCFLEDFLCSQDVVQQGKSIFLECLFTGGTTVPISPSSSINGTLISFFVAIKVVSMSKSSKNSPGVFFFNLK